MSTQESSPPRGRTRIVVGVLAALLVVIVVLAVLVLTGVTRGLFAKDITRTVRNDVDASGLVAALVSYPDSFRGGTLAGGQAELGVQIDQAALRGGDPAAQPATIVLRTYSCPGRRRQACDDAPDDRGRGRRAPRARDPPPPAAAWR